MVHTILIIYVSIDMHKTKQICSRVMLQIKSSMSSKPLTVDFSGQSFTRVTVALTMVCLWYRYSTGVIVVNEQRKELDCSNMDNYDCMHF